MLILIAMQWLQQKCVIDVFSKHPLREVELDDAENYIQTLHFRFVKF